MNRRLFLQTALAAPGMAASTASIQKPRLGVTVGIDDQTSPDAAIAHVKSFGLSTAQVSVGMSPPSLAAPLKAALAKYQVEATAFMTLGEGKMVWDFYGGPLTIGLVPARTRSARIDAIKRASDLARSCGVEAIQTHCGFIPENPNDPLYGETIAAVRAAAARCRVNGQSFLMETGQETPVTLLRAIRDTKLDNVRVNLDTANLILYGKGDPVAALDLLGPHIHGLHAKDGLYPTGPAELGQETPIGEGKVDFPAIIRKLHALKYYGPITIERETSGPEREADIRRSITYLQDLIDKTYT